MRIFNRRSNNGSSTTEPNALLQSGWVGFTFSGTATNTSIAVTFPQAFTGTPIVTLTFGGDQSAGSLALGNGVNSVKLFAAAKAVSVTSTGFTAYIYTTDSTSWVSGQSVYAHWIAVGA